MGVWKDVCSSAGDSGSSPHIRPPHHVARLTLVSLALPLPPLLPGRSFLQATGSIGVREGFNKGIWKREVAKS